MRTRMIIPAVAVLLLGCAKPPEKDLWNSAVVAQQQRDADQAIEAYLRLLDAYPKGERAPEALYALATIYQNDKHDPGKALEYYQRVVNQYPDHATSPNSLFMIGYLYHNDLKQLPEAKHAYEEFLKKYPNDPMAQSAQFELATLGKPPDDVLPPPGKAETRGAGKTKGR